MLSELEERMYQHFKETIHSLANTFNIGKDIIEKSQNPAAKGFKEQNKYN